VTGLSIVLAVPALVALWAVLTHRRLVAARNRCDAAWTELDAVLRRRWALARALPETGRAMAATDAFERARAERDLGAAVVGPAAGLEDEIQAARRIYNADVRLYLTRKRAFPALLVAGLGTFDDRPYFELDGMRERLTLAA
jgi:LemA protein